MTFRPDTHTLDVDRQETAVNLPTTDTDPSGLFGAIGTTAGAVLALGVVAGVLDGETAEAILAVVVTLGPLATAWAIRRHAWAPASVDAREVELRTEQAARDLDGAASATRDRDRHPSPITDAARDTIAEEINPEERRP